MKAFFCAGLKRNDKVPVLEAMEKLIAFYHNKEKDMLKFGF